MAYKEMADFESPPKMNAGEHFFSTDFEIIIDIRVRT